MNTRIDVPAFKQCQHAFVRELAKTLQITLSRDVPKQEMLSNVLFAVCAHLDGSSFCGEIDGQEQMPLIGFSVGDATICSGGGSWLHEIVPDIIREHEVTK